MRRTTNTEIKNLEPRLRGDGCFLQQADGSENGPGLIGNGPRSGAVCHYADGTRGGFGLVRVVMGRLRRRRPHHQEQRKPCRQSKKQSHLSVRNAFASACRRLLDLRFMPTRQD